MNKKESSALKDILIVTCITLASGILLGFVYNITKGPIAREKEAARIASEQEVFADAKEFQTLPDTEGEGFQAAFENALAESDVTGVKLNSVDTAGSVDGAELGYVVDVTDSDGYGGDIQIMVGVRTEGEEPVINGISFLALSETAGMGMKAKEPPFKDQFVDLPALSRIEYVKDGKTEANEIDAISGATITTDAVTDAVNGAILAVETIKEGAK